MFQVAFFPLFILLHLPYIHRIHFLLFCSGTIWMSPKCCASVLSYVIVLLLSIKFCSPNGLHTPSVFSLLTPCLLFTLINLTFYDKLLFYYFQSSVHVAKRLVSYCRLNAANKTKKCSYVFSNGMFSRVSYLKLIELDDHYIM